eukprot:713175-Lingulodinium_polyedra.AAC.1
MVDDGLIGEGALPWMHPRARNWQRLLLGASATGPAGTATMTAFAVLLPDLLGMVRPTAAAA